MSDDEIDLGELESREDFQAEYGTLVVLYGPSKATWMALKQAVGLEGAFKWLYVLGAFFGMKWILRQYTYTVTNGVNGPYTVDALTGVQETLLAIVFVLVLILMRKYAWKVVEEVKANGE